MEIVFGGRRLEMLDETQEKSRRRRLLQETAINFRLR